MRIAREKSSWTAMAGVCFAVLWGIGLFGVLEADVLSAKLFIVSLLGPLSLGLDRFFYGL